VFQPPSFADNKDTSQLIDSSTSNPSLADADTLFSALFGFFNELSANALLAWMVGFVLFVIFSMWQLEKLASRLAQKRATSSASYDRRSRNASKLSSDNFLHTQSYADAEASPSLSIRLSSTLRILLLLSRPSRKIQVVQLDLK
jgi:hypothetical protein